MKPTAIAPHAYRVMIAIASAVLAMDLGGCTTVGPDYVRPEAEVNPSWLEPNRPQAERQQEVAAKRARLAAVEREIADIVAAIKGGTFNRSLTERLLALDREQEMLERQLALDPGGPAGARGYPRMVDGVRRPRADPVGP